MASKIEKINFKDKKTRFKRPNNQEEYLFTAENVNEIKNKLNGMIDGYNDAIIDFPSDDIKTKIEKIVSDFAPSIPGNQFNELNDKITKLKDEINSKISKLKDNINENIENLNEKEINFSYRANNQNQVIVPLNDLNPFEIASKVFKITFKNDTYNYSIFLPSSINKNSNDYYYMFICVEEDWRINLIPENDKLIFHFWNKAPSLNNQNVVLYWK